MTDRTADVVICGAGIAGIATAYALTVRYGVSDVLLVDELPPLSLTSSRSSECYRNWWPGPDAAMVRLMNNSIDLIEDLAHQSGNTFQLNRRGYLFTTANPEVAQALDTEATTMQGFGAGQLRKHAGTNTGVEYTPASPDGFEDQPEGADLILDQDAISKHFPYLAPETCAVLHVRRAGWLSAQQMGMYMLRRSREAGLRFVDARVVGVNLADRRLVGVRLDKGASLSTIAAGQLVIAAGPFCRRVASFLDVDLPLVNERHLSMSFKDTEGILPRSAPLLIWCDEQRLPWTREEQAELDNDEDRWRLGPLPPGVHARPEGSTESQTVLALWPYATPVTDPVYPVQTEPDYPEMVMRGLQTMIPDFKAYFRRLPTPTMDGGYYTKTPENRPLLGPLPVEGAWIIGGLSGFGVMASAGSGDILAASIVGARVPEFAARFHPSRYEDPDYLKLMDAWENPLEL